MNYFGRDSRKRVNRVLRVNSTTRAIRAGLAVSATMLALAGSSAALAGTCAVTGLVEVTCNGVFTDDVTNTVPVINVVPDLTLVVGDDGSTTVDPAAGVSGITSTWGGDATVITYAEITTDGADGVYMYSDETATFVNEGVIQTYASSYGDNAVDVSAVGDVSVTNTGFIDTYSYSYGITSLSAVSYDGSVSIDNQADAAVFAFAFYASTAVAAYGYDSVDVNNAGAIGAFAYGSATGVDAVSQGDVQLDNSGSISATSVYASAYGADLYSIDGAASFYNSADGSVEALSYYSNAVGVEVSGESASAVNNGTISAIGYNVAAGLNVDGYSGDASLDNNGSIYANGDQGFGAQVSTYLGDVLLDNSGSIVAVGGSMAVGAVVNAVYGSATAVNSGQISADALGSATGLLGFGFYTSIDNSGEIDATAYFGTANGISAYAFGAYSSVDVVNSGYVDAYSYFGRANGIFVEDDGYASAISVDNSGTVEAESVNSFSFGIYVNAYYGTVDIANSGDVLAYGASFATGISAYSQIDAYVSISNTGTIYAAAGTSNANGILTVSDGTGDTYVVNGGDIVANSDSGFALGMNLNSVDGDITAVNTGNIYAYAGGPTAFGIDFDITGSGDAAVDNSGVILAVGDYFATGLDLRTYSGDIEVANSGYITAYAGLSAANGIFASSNGGGDIVIDNSGEILASGGTFATGLNLRTYVDGEITVTNSGDITADGGANSGAGIRARTLGTGSVTIDNSGSVSASSVYSGASGVYVFAVGGGDVTVDNSGYVYAYGDDYGFGLNLNSNGGDIAVENSGSIYAGSPQFAWGIEIGSYVSGDVSIINTGSVEAQAIYGEAIGVHTTSVAGDFYLYNSDSIVAGSVYGSALGVDAQVTATYATATVVNAGSIAASSTYGDATGVSLAASGAFGVTSLYNSGSISAEAYYGTAIGAFVYASGIYGEATADNSGSIYAASGYSAQGATVIGGKYAALTNAGDIVTVASNEGGGIAFAFGATAYSFYGEAMLDNSGTIDTLAEGSYALAIGAYAGIYGGNASVLNSGDIVTTANGIYAASATGIMVESALLSATVYNSGTVEATAAGAYADAVGATATAGEFGLVYTTDGSSIAAVAIGYYDADATGAEVVGLFANLYGEGAISAEATADAVYGDARAYGADVYGSFTGIYVLGDGSISASAEGAYALAVGALQDGYFTAFHNEGSIEASATGETGFAIGAMTLGYYGVHMYNSGEISATGSGDGVEAVGVFARSLYGNVDLTNEGSITASADYFAVAVQLESYYYTGVFNYGDIEASGAEVNLAIYTTGPSVDYIYNYGTITGAIFIGDGNDYLLNEGEWNPGQTPSYFGAGDDTIINTGTINLEDSVIALGTYSVDGNFFYNYGTITVDGTNTIDMGGPQALVPSANPNAFYNGGVIDFQDGAADDILYITGDFAGDGDINVDVSGLDGVSDILYIDGSVVSGTAGVINVDLLDLPESIETLVPVVYVSGDSVASNFTLGDVNWDEDNSFVTLDFGLVADIDATNADPDVFALGIEVTGLSDPGTLAASIAPSVQSLMNSQTGTWRQRMGVIDSFSDGAVALWARVFQNEGSFSPDHSAANFGNGGNFDWDQKNSGVEGGIDFSVTDEFSLGLMVGTSQADTDLDSTSNASSDIEADTWGVYGTWISPNGFYLDASYRWMSFDVDLSSIAGSMEAEGDAESFNIELGYAWTLEGGLKIEPQLQYTKTNVDNIDVLVTTSGMSFHNEGGDSSRGRLGVAIRKSFGEADTGWLWTPYATLSAVREFDGENAYSVNNVFFGETTVEGTSALLELGFTARHQNWSIYGGLNWQDGGAVNSFFGGQLGVRYTFGGAAPAPAPVAAPAKTCADLDDDGDGVNNCDDKCLGSTAGQAVGPDGCPVPLTIDLKGVNFDFDKATLRPDAVMILDEAVAILGKYPDLKVEVAGHTDSIGSEQYNQGLSERRAQAVYDYLAGHGIDAGRMVGPSGYGETRPIAPNTNEDGSDNPEGRAKNRRTELNVQN